MKLSTGFSDLGRDKRELKRTSKSIYYGRVLDIILDDTHPEYEKYGRTYSIGAIKFAPIDRPTLEEDESEFPIAFPLEPGVRKLPLKNEIVSIIAAPSRNISTTRSSEYTLYYTSTINLWNTSVNPAPSLDFDGEDVDLGYEYTQDLNENILLPFHGDVILEGRHGQGLRFTGARSAKNPYTGTDNANQPLTILTNGISQSNLTNTLSLENINEDTSSIYLTSNHIIELEQSRDKYAGAKKRPILAKNYKGPQVIINSGRLFFNSYSEDTLFTTQENFGVSAKNVFIDAEDSIGFDATKIYLGEKAVRFELQPTILGNQLELFLDTLLSELLRVSNAFKNAKTIDGKIIPTLVSEGYTLEAVVKTLQNRINPNGDSQLKSKKVFTE